MIVKTAVSSHMLNFNFTRLPKDKIGFEVIHQRKGGLDGMQGKIPSNQIKVFSQCGNVMIILSLRFYVKSILGILEGRNLPF